MDGKFVPFNRAYIPFLTHSFHYGSAAFEGERFYNTPKGPAAFRLPEHTDRLVKSARAIGIRIPYSKKRLIQATKTLIKKNGIKEGYIRPIAYYGAGMALLTTQIPVHTAIAVWPWGKYLGHGAVKVKITKIKRLYSKSIVPTAKISGYYANSILATLEAHNNGFDEALMLDSDGFIAEGPGENIFFVKGRTIYTPKTGSILPGITRDTVMRIAKDLKYKVIEKKLTVRRALEADEAFFAGTAAEITPIAQINNKKFKQNAVTEDIKKMYGLAARGKIKKYSKWLTYIMAN